MTEFVVCLLFSVFNVLMVVLFSSDLFLVFGFSLLSLVGLIGCLVFNE